MTQKDIADASQNEESWLSRVLQGMRRNVDAEMLSRLIDKLGAILEEKGHNEKAEQLKQVFSVDHPFPETAARAVKEMVITALVSSGLGLSREQAEKFCDHPLLESRLEAAQNVFSAAIAALRTVSQPEIPEEG